MTEHFFSEATFAGSFRPINYSSALIGPMFGESSLNEMLQSLDRYYTAIKTLMNTPGSISYSDLVSLRRRAAQPDLGLNPFNRLQIQLKLAVELLRLGRRTEGYALLNQIEDRLPLLSRVEQTRPLALVYGLWLTLVRAAVDKTEVSMHQLAALSSDPAMADAVQSFFYKV